MRGKKRPNDERAQAVGLALVKGVPAASKATGIPQRTLRHWKQDPEFAELGLSAREEVATAMWVGIQVGLEEVHKGLTNPDERLRDKADAVSMLIEKRALLVGEATSRSEARDITNRFNDHENDWASELVRAVIEDKAGSRASAPTVEMAEPAGTEAAQD